MSAYRDDLEVTLQRADDLEREVAELRERNQKLTAELAGGETEATANARRLAAAIAREQEEQRLREEADVDERAARTRAKHESAARRRAVEAMREPYRQPERTTPGDPWISALVTVALLGAALIAAFGVAGIAVAVLAVIVIGALGLLATRGAPGG